MPMNPFARCRRWLSLACHVVLAVCPTTVLAVEAPQPPAPPPNVAAPMPALDALVKRLVIEHVPRFVEKSDNWGHTKEIVSGLDVKREGWELHTRRHRKAVNDGTWKWYRCELTEPERNLDIRITPRADAAEGAKRFDVVTIARLKVQARWQKWVSGVQLASISGDANAVIRLDLGCRVKFELDTAKFPPDLIVMPFVERAEVRLLDLDVDRISKLHGDLAEELGRVLRPTIEREIARRQEELAPKLNALLTARQSELRFSLTSWINKGWSSWWNPDASKTGK